MTRGPEQGSHKRYALTADRVFDGVSVHTGHAVLVDNGIVVGLLPGGMIPDGVPLHAFPGCTVIPGLIDAHIHFMRWQGPGYLAHGVTTIRDTGNALDWILERRREAKDHLWPRIVSLGPLLDGPSPFHTRVARRCESPAAAVDAVRETIEAGVDGIKFYVGLPVDWLPAMVRECHDRGIKASIHCGGSGLRASMRSGVDEFYHLDGVLADVWREGRPPGWLDAWGDRGITGTLDEQRRLADDILAAGITATPTLAYWDSQWRTRTPAGHGPDATALVPPIITEWQSAPINQAAADKWRRALDAALRFTGMLIERGVGVLAGTDVPCGAVPPGLSLWKEIRYLHEAGMSTVGALRAATSSVSAYLKRPDIGHLRPGAVADLAVIRGNVFDAIPERPDIVRVARAGTLLDHAELLDLARNPLADGPLAAGLAPEAPDPWVEQFRLHFENARKKPNDAK